MATESDVSLRMNGCEAEKESNIDRDLMNCLPESLPGLPYSV